MNDYDTVKPGCMTNELVRVFLQFALTKSQFNCISKSWQKNRKCSWDFYRKLAKLCENSVIFDLDRITVG